MLKKIRNEIREIANHELGLCPGTGAQRPLRFRGSPRPGPDRPDPRGRPGRSRPGPVGSARLGGTRAPAVAPEVTGSPSGGSAGARAVPWPWAGSRPRRSAAIGSGPRTGAFGAGRPVPAGRRGEAGGADLVSGRAARPGRRPRGPWLMGSPEEGPRRSPLRSQRRPGRGRNRLRRASRCAEETRMREVTRASVVWAAPGTRPSPDR